jgi:hypothetical protein
MKSETSEWALPVVGAIVIWVWILLMILIGGGAA